MQTINVMSLRHDARKIYPESSGMQRKWLRATIYLYQTGKHALITGGWRR